MDAGPTGFLCCAEGDTDVKSTYSYWAINQKQKKVKGGITRDLKCVRQIDEDRETSKEGAACEKTLRCKKAWCVL